MSYTNIFPFFKFIMPLLLSSTSNGYSPQALHSEHCHGVPVLVMIILFDLSHQYRSSWLFFTASAPSQGSKVKHARALHGNARPPKSRLILSDLHICGINVNLDMSLADIRTCKIRTKRENSISWVVLCTSSSSQPRNASDRRPDPERPEA
jgi:hypothetical protein